MSVFNIKKQKQNNLKKVASIEKPKSLILRAHDIIKLLLDFVELPANREILPITCEFDQLLSGILQILKKMHFVYLSI